MFPPPEANGPEPFASPRYARRLFERPRQPVRETNHPSFRARGIGRRAVCLRAIENLARRNRGFTWASHDAIRVQMHREARGEAVPGEVRDLLRAFKREGVIDYYWQHAGELYPDGQLQHGTLITVCLAHASRNTLEAWKSYKGCKSEGERKLRLAQLLGTPFRGSLQKDAFFLPRKLPEPSQATLSVNSAREALALLDRDTGPPPTR